MDADLLPILKGATALLFPSLAEGFGLPVLEAYAAAVPVITSNTTAIPEVAGDAALTVQPLDVDSITQCMQRVMVDHSLREELIRRGRVRALSFSWDHCAEQTILRYQHLLS